MLPVIIIAAVVVPLLVIAFAATRRSRAAGEHPAVEDDATRARTEQEFAAAEAYQAEWRAEERAEEQKHPRERL